MSDIIFHINVVALGVGGVKWLRLELYAKLVGLKVLGRSICDCGSHARKGSHLLLGGECAMRKSVISSYVDGWLVVWVVGGYGWMNDSWEAEVEEGYMATFCEVRVWR